VLWTRVARRDLEEIIDFIAADRPTAARRLFERIEKRALALGSLPDLGRVVPELWCLRIEAYRELVLRPYRLVYRVEAERVLVMGPFDGRRDLEDLLLDRLLRS
jgi:toxin ParE1/3/4